MTEAQTIQRKSCADFCAGPIFQFTLFRKKTEENIRCMYRGALYIVYEKFETAWELYIIGRKLTYK